MRRNRAPRPTRSRGRFWLVVIVAAVILLGGVGVVVWRVQAAGSASTTTQRTAEVTQQTMKETVGATTIEVTDGLTVGQTLVLADNSTALPTNSSNRGLRTGGAGTFAGTGGLPAGGAPPGGR